MSISDKNCPGDLNKSCLRDLMSSIKKKMYIGSDTTCKEKSLHTCIFWRLVYVNVNQEIYSFTILNFFTNKHKKLFFLLTSIQVFITLYVYVQQFDLNIVFFYKNTIGIGQTFREDKLYLVLNISSFTFYLFLGDPSMV